MTLIRLNSQQQEKLFTNSAKNWLAQAKADLSWAKHDFAGGQFRGCCFVCQQIAEKSLKAFLRSKKVAYSKKFKIHNLEKLLEFCLRFDSQFKELKVACQRLKHYYAPTRYPDVLAEQFKSYTKTQAQKALSDAKKIFQFVKAKISSC